MRDLAYLPFSWVGRRALHHKLLFRLWKFLVPLAALYRRTRLRRVRVIAVVGSFGKTTTARAVAAALGLPAETIRGHNAGGFLARGLFEISPTDRWAVIEVGIGRRGEMARAARLLRPDVVVVTSIGSEHQRWLGTLEEIRNEKAEALRALTVAGKAILNGDDPNVRWMGGQTSAAVMTFGFDVSNDACAIEYVARGIDGGSLTIRLAGRSHELSTRLVGRHMSYAILAALLVAHTEGVDVEAARNRLAILVPTARRLFPRRLASGAMLLMDDYKAVQETIGAAIDAIAQVPARRRIVVFGGIFEPPAPREAAYEKAGRDLSRSADVLIFLGEPGDFPSLLQGVRAGAGLAVSVLDADQSVHRAARLIEQAAICRDDVVLLKGIGFQRLERIALLLEDNAVSCRRRNCPAPPQIACRECRLL